MEADNTYLEAKQAAEDTADAGAAAVGAMGGAAAAGGGGGGGGGGVGAQAAAAPAGVAIAAPLWGAGSDITVPEVIDALLLLTPDDTFPAHATLSVIIRAPGFYTIKLGDLLPQSRLLCPSWCNEGGAPYLGGGGKPINRTDRDPRPSVREAVDHLRGFLTKQLAASEPPKWVRPFLAATKTRAAAMASMYVEVTLERNKAATEYTLGDLLE